MKQIPFDFSQTGVLLEDRILKIIQEGAALQAPRESTEPVKFRVSCGICQLRGIELCCVEPAISIWSRDVNRVRRNDEQVELWNVRQRIDFIALANAERAATFEEKGDVGAESGGEFK